MQFFSSEIACLILDNLEEILLGHTNQVGWAIQGHMALLFPVLIWRLLLYSKWHLFVIRFSFEINSYIFKYMHCTFVICPTKRNLLNKFSNVQKVWGIRIWKRTGKKWKQFYNYYWIKLKSLWQNEKLIPVAQLVATRAINPGFWCWIPAC